MDVSGWMVSFQVHYDTAHQGVRANGRAQTATRSPRGAVTGPNLPRAHTLPTHTRQREHTYAQKLHKNASNIDPAACRHRLGGSHGRGGWSGCCCGGRHSRRRRRHVRVHDPAAVLGHHHAVACWWHAHAGHAGHRTWHGGHCGRHCRHARHWTGHHAAHATHGSTVWRHPHASRVGRRCRRRLAVRVHLTTVRRRQGMGTHSVARRSNRGR